MLKFSKIIGAIAAVATLAGGAGAAHAADLYGGRGSIKDDNLPILMRAPAGPCYMRADVGYSLSGTPDVRWPVTDPGTGAYLGSRVSQVDIADTWLLEGGVGCSGSGWRGEFVLGYRGNRKIDGEPILWNPPMLPIDDPLHTSITTYTAMLNAYRNLGSWGNFTPYVGAGMGIAYHMVGDTTFTENPSLIHTIEGNRDISFAWQVMAGVGYQLTDRAVPDLGYRYIDMGKATSGRADTAGFVNPRVVVDDITAHELKIGIRYHFGADNGRVSMK